MNNRYFVTGIGTDVGKTVVSAIMVEALKADYWKPVQAGTEPTTDTETVRSWVTHQQSTFFEEGIILPDPMSPHAAAENAGVQLELKQLNLPQTGNPLIIEGAGGAMVPLNHKELVIDMVNYFEARAVLVSRNYLGSINHTLMTYEVLRKWEIPIVGIVFNGKSNAQTEEYLLRYTKLPCLLRVEEESLITREVIRNYAQLWNQK